LQASNHLSCFNKSKNERKFTCLWVGRLVPVKAPDRLIEIARELIKLNLEFEFLVAGDGPLRNKIEEQSRSEQLPIKFLGWTNNTPAMFSLADIMILTSINEGTPISIIEAQRLGKPVVSTNVGSVTEVIRDGKSGFAIEYDAKTFAELIHGFAVNPNMLGNFSKEAISHSSEKFSSERLSLDHVRIYRQIMSN